MSVLSVLVDEVDLNPPLRALCAGYEAGTWRADGLARAMSEALPNFALSYAERQRFTSYTGVRLLRRAAETIYASDKYAKRGEFGELLLHVVLTEFFGTEPAISKLFFKDTPNDTVKGFDSVHVARVDEALELWLGEVKYYEDLDDAIRDVLREPVGCRPELANRRACTRDRLAHAFSDLRAAAGRVRAHLDPQGTAGADIGALG